MYSPPLSVRRHLIFKPNSFSTCSLNWMNLERASLLCLRKYTQVKREKPSTTIIIYVKPL
ncbi:hypothetical protein ACHQM5_028986 [Ranunculus cassubicifolius]